MIHVLDYHEYVVYKGGVHAKWHPCMILAAVKKSIDSTLGLGSYDLLIKTIKLIYHYDPVGDHNLLMSRPELFEGILPRMLGSSADKVLGRIQKEITSELSYLRHINDDDKNNPAEMRS